MLLGKSNNFVEILVAEVQPSIAGSTDGGDIRVKIRVQYDTFSASTFDWVMLPEWEKFLEQLVKLEAVRVGNAVLVGASPDQLQLRIFVWDALGHMAIEGHIGNRSIDRDLKLQFSKIEFDPTALLELINELKSCGDGLTKR